MRQAHTEGVLQATLCSRDARVDVKSAKSVAEGERGVGGEREGEGENLEQ